MTPMLLATVPLAAVGFALLVQTSPLGRIPYKPFICRVCLSGWGSILVAGLFLERPQTLGEVDTLVAWFTLALYGTGAARILFTLSEALQAYADRGSGDLSLPPMPQPMDDSTS